LCADKIDFVSTAFQRKVLCVSGGGYKKHHQQVRLHPGSIQMGPTQVQLW